MRLMASLDALSTTACISKPQGWREEVFILGRGVCAQRSSLHASAGISLLNEMPGCPLLSKAHFFSTALSLFKPHPPLQANQ